MHSVSYRNSVSIFLWPNAAGCLRTVLLAVLLMALASGARAQVRINEFVASNQTGLTDADGDRPDWIELFNAGGEPVNLAGWGLTDNPDQPHKWVFPAVTLAPGAYRVVFASDKDRRSAADELHTNFKLSAEGEFLGLYDNSLPPRLVSGLAPAFPPQPADVAYGVTPDGTWAYFERPTPGAVNDMASVFDRELETPAFDPPRGFYDGPLYVRLTSPDPQAEIRYTLDGTEPTETNGRIYSDPIMLVQPRAIRAAAFRPGYRRSPVATHSYLVNVPRARRSLPVVSIVGDPGESLYSPNGIMASVGGEYVDGLWQPVLPTDYHNPLVRGLERPVSVEWIDPRDNSGFQIDCGIRFHGGEDTRRRFQIGDDWSIYRPYKPSFRLYFRGSYGASKLTAPLFDESPLETFDKLVLRGGKNDWKNPFISDEFGRRLFRDMGQLAAHGTIVNLFINGEYKYYFNPTERYDSDYLNAWLKRDSTWDVLDVQGAREGSTTFYYNLLNYCEQYPDTTSDAVFREIERRVDLINFIDYVIVQTYAANYDWPMNNIVRVREHAPGARLWFLVWDIEVGFQLDRIEQNRFFGSWTSLDEIGGIGSIYRALRSHPEFRLMWSDRVQKHFHNDGALTQENLYRRFDELARVMREVLPDMKTDIRDEWIPRRGPILLQQMADAGLLVDLRAPELEPHGGRIERRLEVTARSPDGAAIWLTTDGSDPRTSMTGTVAPGAVAWDGPLTLDRYTRVRARAQLDGAWSPLVEADYLTAEPGEIIISEVFIDADGNDDDREWFEIYNTTSRPINIEGWTIADNDGDSHTIAAGRPVVVAARGYLVLGQSSDQSVNGGVPVDYVYGRDIVLGNGGDELFLLQGDLVMDSVGWGDFEPLPRKVAQRLPAPVVGSASGLAGDYSGGSTGDWRIQTAVFGDGHGTPGLPNTGAALPVFGVPPEFWRTLP